MRKFSWHTSKVKYEGNGCYVTNKVHHALTNFAYSECVEHYRPNMKGGHTHNHIYNVCNRILFRSKNVRQIDPTQKQKFREVFEMQVFGGMNPWQRLYFLDILKKGKSARITKKRRSNGNY